MYFFMEVNTTVLHNSISILIVTNIVIVNTTLLNTMCIKVPYSTVTKAGPRAHIQPLRTFLSISFFVSEMVRVPPRNPQLPKIATLRLKLRDMHC